MASTSAAPPSSSSSSDLSSSSPWAPVKALAALVEAAVLQKRPGLRHDLEAALRRHKPKFIALLKNTPRNAGDADLVRKAQTAGIRLSADGSIGAPGTGDTGGVSSGDGAGSVQKLPPQVVEEALIIAEMFNLNEIVSLQLLLKGEEQLNEYPGLTRGLVSVLLYYDARKALAQSLRILIQGREGLTWTLELPAEVTELISHFTEQLVEDGMVEKILRLLDELDWTKEAANLQKNMALGDAKHRRQVKDLFDDIRQSLADCVFAYAAQSGLSKNDTVRLLDYLAKIKVGDGDSSGVIDNINMTLLMAFFYAVDVSALNKCEDGEAAVETLPLLNDPTFIPTLHRELGGHSPRQWGHDAIQASVHFAWAMTVAGLRSLPNHDAAQSVVEDDELVMDLALDNKVFHHLPGLIFKNKSLRTEEFYLRRLHQMLTDMVVLMPLKVKELRNRADDAARNCMMHEKEGVHFQVPLSGQHFEHLLRTITALYNADDVGLGLVMDYWCPPDVNSSIVERCPQRQVSLYKFVRLAGDLLLPYLYVPYLDLLTSLSGHPQAALHCFNLLKLNGLSGGQHGASTISWDHFFASLQQYFANLRQEQPLSQTMLPVGDTIYHPHTRPMTRGISPAEIKGLASVLRLLQAVADNCEAARVALAENSAWQPLLIFAGLLGCPVPAELKAELLRSLASVSKSSDIAHIVWQNVESAQLISTIPSMGVARSGLGMELESVETRAEEYPISRAFLHLLDVLTESSIPGTLGGGNRPPGFEPYLAYVRDSLFLKFNARAYRDPSEKWEIVAGCLNFFCKILVEYVPTPADFVKVSQTEPPVVGKHPGYFLLLDLFQSSELLRLLLFIIDECCAVLEKYQPFPGKEMVEKSCLLALKLLKIALITERTFLEAAKTANSPVLLTALSQLLQGINPRSGRPDHMLGIAKFVTFAWWQPTSALYAIQIISAVSDSPGSQQGLLAAFTSSGEKVAQNIIKGFTDILDNDEEEDQTNHGNTNSDSKSLSAARIHVVQMLLNGLDKPAPSVSHFLLGFNLKEPLSKSNLQPPGVLGSIRTPFHAILSFLRPASARVPNPSIQRSPNMCEASYRLIYHLSANLQTSDPTLRYLRSSEDFLTTQLTLLPLPDELAASAPILKGFSWLLKTVAIELKLVSAARLRSQVTLLIQLLLEAQSPGQVDRNDESILGVTTVEEAALSQLSRSAAIPHGTTRLTTGALSSTFHVGSSGQQQHRLLQVLNSIDFEEECVPTPKWEVFDSTQVSQVLKGCEQRGPQGEKLINVQALHKILNDELVGLQGSAALNQRQIIQDEIKSILLYAVGWNSLQQQGAVKRSILDAWRQVTEVLLCSVPSDILPPAYKQQLLLDLLQTLLNKVLADGTMPDLANQVSGVVLLLLTALMQTYDNPDDALNPASGPPKADNYISMLDSTRTTNQRQKSTVYSTALQVILKGLIMWISNTSSAAQRVRSNLYGALLNYLRIGKDNQAASTTSRVLSSLTADSDYGKFRKANLEVLHDFGDNFLDTLCRDTVSGHDIRRMLALSVLDELVYLDARGSWTYYMSNQGYLRHIIESMSVEDAELTKLLNPDPDNLRAIYVYESKMALLTRLASSVAGAELLLQSGLMLRLSEMIIFSNRPDVSTNAASLALDEEMGEDESLIPSPLSRYHQILFPALRLCQALLASLGSGNKSATSQVRHFINSNEEMVRSVLRGRANWSLAYLQELSLLTGIISRSFSSDVDFVNSASPTSAADLEKSANSTRVQRLMLSLVPLCDLSDASIGRIQGDLPEKSKKKGFTLLMEVMMNVTAFARNLAFGSSRGVVGKFLQVVFSPTLTDAIQRGDQGLLPAGVVFPNRSPSLSHLVILIRNLCSTLLSIHAELRDLNSKLSSVEHFSTSELTTLLIATSVQALPAFHERLSAADKRSLAKARIGTAIKIKEHERNLAESAMENVASLCHGHLEYFLLHTNTNPPLTSYQRAHRRVIGADTSMSADMTLGGDALSESLSLDALQSLKEDVRACFTDAFYLRLEDVEQLYKDRGTRQQQQQQLDRFLDVIIRRLRRITSIHA